MRPQDAGSYWSLGCGAAELHGLEEASLQRIESEKVETDKSSPAKCRFKHQNVLWRFKFSQLKGSSDDGKTRVKLLFQHLDTKQIETKPFAVAAVAGEERRNLLFAVAAVAGEERCNLLFAVAAVAGEERCNLLFAVAAVAGEEHCNLLLLQSRGALSLTL
ncbi:hypothetical protein P7K49_029975 [Saguinus oedipus]|uniref:Uncharacterized protein n=1 Tax=Saguinus oedipus TaxID=9490 RepID=A0ABQ9U8R4_SAGOE|nr:hypothetical protein P7K49_029975 [Saguinus oedipus]